LAIFVGAAALSLPAAIFAASMAIGMAGGSTRPLVAAALVGAIAAGGVLLVTAMLLRWEGADLSVLGLPLDGRRLLELAVGFVVSAALFLAVAGAQSVGVGAPWLFQGSRGVLAALSDLPAVMALVVVEELLFRGFLLRALRAVSGDRAAIVLSALAFGAYHVVGTRYWAMGAVFQFLMPTVGGLLFAWAAVRTGGLALPLGLHLGGNWVQTSVAAFSAASPAAEPMRAVWRIPISASDFQVLTAPDILPHLPFLFAMALAACCTWQIAGRRVAGAQPLRLPKQ
jgi:membrane protease YdiL (CAAX protease family)